MPVRERYVWVCTNRRPAGHPKGSCADKCSEELLQGLKRAIAERGLADRIRATSSGCLDLCEAGITLAVAPDGALLGNVTPKELTPLVEALEQGGALDENPALASKILPSP